MCKLNYLVCIFLSKQFIFVYEEAAEAEEEAGEGEGEGDGDGQEEEEEEEEEEERGGEGVSSVHLKLSTSTFSMATFCKSEVKIRLSFSCLIQGLLRLSLLKTSFKSHLIVIPVRKIM